MQRALGSPVTLTGLFEGLRLDGRPLPSGRSLATGLRGVVMRGLCMSLSIQLVVVYCACSQFVRTAAALHGHHAVQDVQITECQPC